MTASTSLRKGIVPLAFAALAFAIPATAFADQDDERIRREGDAAILKVERQRQELEWRLDVLDKALHDVKTFLVEHRDDVSSVGRVKDDRMLEAIREIEELGQDRLDTLWSTKRAIKLATQELIRLQDGQVNGG